MQKHTAFWLGAFSASIIVVAVAVGAWSVATERALSIVAMLIGAILAFTFTLYLALVSRKFILNKVLGVAEASLNEVASHAADTLEAVGNGDTRAAKSSATRLSATFIGWWAWSNFYKWVIGTNVALLIAFGGLAGTVLLFEQNKRLREQTNELIEQRKELRVQSDRFELQNELIGLSLVSDFRERLRTTIESPDMPEFKVTISGESCDVRGNTEYLKVASNLSAINALSDLLSSPLLEDKVVKALVSLAEDSDHSVRLGAVLALNRAGKMPKDFSASFHNVFMKHIDFEPQISLSFSDSYIANIHCPNCDINFSGSVVGISGSMEFTASNSLVFSNSYLSRESDGNLIWSSDLTDAALAEERPTYTGADGQNSVYGNFRLDERYYYGDYLQEFTMEELTSVAIREGELVKLPIDCEELEESNKTSRFMSFSVKK